MQASTLSLGPTDARAVGPVAVHHGLQRLRGAVQGVGGEGPRGVAGVGPRLEALQAIGARPRGSVAGGHGEGGAQQARRGGAARRPGLHGVVNRRPPRQQPRHQARAGTEARHARRVMLGGATGWGVASALGGRGRGGGGAWGASAPAPEEAEGPAWLRRC